MSSMRLTAAGMAFLCAPALGQGLAQTLVADSSADTLFICTDANTDGDYDDSGEIVSFYDDVQGSITLGTNSSITVGPDGTLYMSDSNQDIILAMKDLNADGDALDTGEYWIFFDGDPTVNAAGVPAWSFQDIYCDANGRIWACNASVAAGGFDSILWIEDIDGSGNANDGANEAAIYSNHGNGTDSLPTAVWVGLDGLVYYAEGGTSGVLTKGCYKLDDISGDGTIDPSTERFAYYLPPIGANAQFFWALHQTSAGVWFMADSGGDETIYRFEDTNTDGVITTGTEDHAWWTAPGSSQVYDINFYSDGSAYVCESYNPDRLLRMVDVDGNGTIDPVTEVTTIYDETLGLTI